MADAHVKVEDDQFDTDSDDKSVASTFGWAMYLEVIGGDDGCAHGSIVKMPDNITVVSRSQDGIGKIEPEGVIDEHGNYRIIAEATAPLGSGKTSEAHVWDRW